MKLTRRMLGCALAATATVGLALPAAAQQATQALTSESVIEQIKQDGVIRIGLSLFVPWSMRDKNGDLIGYELDVGRKLAEDMGVEVEFVPTSWDGIIPALVAGNFDVIISGSRGATPAVVIADNFPEAQLLLFDEDGASSQEVLNGNAHATMAAQPTPNREAGRNPETLVVLEGDLYDPRGEGFALRKGDPDALNYFNNWIAQQWRSGWLEGRHNYWFATEEWADQVAQ